MTSQARKNFTRVMATAALGTAVFCGSSPAAAAGYSPGAYVGNAPVGSFPKVLVSATIGPAGGVLKAKDSRGTIKLQVPAHVFPGVMRSYANVSSRAQRGQNSPGGVQIAMYSPQPAIIAKLLPAHVAYVDAVAVGWSAPGKASKKLLLTITSKLITSRSRVFETTKTGLKPFKFARVKSGRVILHFKQSDGFVVANPAASK